MVDNTTTYINEANFPKATTTEITNVALSTATTPLTAGVKLQGKLTIENYPLLETIDLLGNELEEIIFVNCPKLKDINVSRNGAKLKILDIERLKIDAAGKPTTNNLKVLSCGGNVIEKIDFTYCQNLKDFMCPTNSALDRIENIDRVDGIELINMRNSGPVKVMHATKEAVFRSVVEEVKDLFGVEHAGELPMEDWVDPKDGKTKRRINKLQLKTDLNDKVIAIQNPQLIADKNKAEKEAKEAKEKLGTAEIAKTELEAKIKKITSELGLDDNATPQQILAKIKELKGGGGSSNCSHTDYDTIKSERDSLETDNKNKKRKIEELESRNNNNDTSAVNKRALTDITNWGIKVSDDQKKALQNAGTVEKMEELRSGIVKSEISKLKDESGSAFNLNIALGILAIGSWVAIAWLVMKDTSLPKTEPEPEKKKTK